VQFDDHHLPIGDLKFQIAYHFTVADFPNDTEDEVINPSNITTEIDGQEYQVMLDFTGETAPEIQFALPAYANEAQRIANEQQRIDNEEQRIENEQQRIANEEQRIAAEQGRVSAESGRVTEFQQMMQQAGTAIEGAENVDAELDGYDLTITNRQGVQKTVYTKGVSGGMLFPVMNFDSATGILTISGLQQEVDRIRYDYATAELIISFPMYNN
jgi:Lsr2.